MAELKFTNSYLKTLNKTNTKSNTIKSLTSQKTNLETKIKSEGGNTDENPSFLTSFFNALDSLSNAIKVPLQRSLRNESKGLLTDIAEGFTYKEQGSYSNILEELGSTNKAVNFLGGLALEIVADPLNYIPVAGAISAGKEATNLVSNINQANKLVKGQTIKEATTTLKGIDNIRNVDKTLLNISGARLKAIKPLGFDTGVLGYTLDDIIFGAAFKGVGRGFKTAYRGIEKLSPDMAEQLTGLGRYAKSLFKNSANINKESPLYAKVLGTKAQQEYTQKNLDKLGTLVVKDITNEANNLVKLGKFKDYDTAYKAVNEEILKAIQNKTDVARTIPEIINSLLKNGKYTFAKNLDELIANKDVLSDLVTDLQKAGVVVEKGAKDIGTRLFLDSEKMLDDVTRTEYVAGLKTVMDKLVTAGNTAKITMPKFQHVANELLDQTKIGKMADGVNTFLEVLQSSVKDRQDLIAFTQAMGNDAWIPKIATREFKEHNLTKDFAQNNAKNIANYSKEVIGDADYKLFSQVYDTTAIDTNIILGCDLFDYDISRIMQEANQRFTKNVYADVLKYDVINAALADGVIKPIEVKKTADLIQVPNKAPAGFTEINVSELQHAVDSMYNVNKVVFNYDNITDTLKAKEKATKELNKLSNLKELTKEQAEKSIKLSKEIEKSTDILNTVDMKTMEEFNNLTITSSKLKEVSEASAVKGRVFVDNGYLNMIKRVTGAKEEVKGLLNIYNKTLGLFKTTSLFSVGFHLRNFFGNTMNMYLRGIPITEGLKYTQKASIELATVGKVNSELAKTLYENPKLMDLIKNSDNATQGLLTIVKTKMPEKYNVFKDWITATTDGIFDSNKYIAEIANGATQGYKSAYGTVAKVRKAVASPFEANFKLGQFSDNASRYAIYKWAKANPTKLSELRSGSARMLSKEVMFDFNDLTSFEVNGMRAIMPFYTWASKNIAFQFRNMMVNSGKYRNVVKMYNSFKENAEKSGQEQPNYAEWTLPIPIGDGSKVEYLSLTPTFIDGFNFISGMIKPSSSGESFLAGSNPFFKSYLESQSGNDMFTGQALDNSDFLWRLSQNLGGGLKRNIFQGQLVNGFYKSKSSEDVKISNLYNDLERLRKEYNKVKKE